MRINVKFFIKIFLVSLLLCLCNMGCVSDFKGRYLPEMQVHRFDKLQNEFFVSNSFTALQKMRVDYPQATNLLVEDVLNIGTIDNDNIAQFMREYYSDTLLQILHRDALMKFEDMSQIEEKLSKAFLNLKKELPHIVVPQVYAQLSALNQSVVVGDSILGFSIDKYMGSDYPLYDTFYYEYQSRSMTSERIVPDCLLYYLLSEYPFPWEWHRTLLDHILHRGKIHWVVYKIMEFDELYEELGYSEVEAAWCSKHRESLWDFLVKSGHLHSTDPMLVRAYMQPASCTYPLGKESPMEVGVWLGMKIIDEYMEKNEKLRIADLLRDTDYKNILRSLGINY